jgi:rubrerythrin
MKIFPAEYQAIIAYVTYSQVLKGPEYMDIADQLEIHAKQELEHALAIARALAHTFCQAAATSRRNRSTDTCKLPVWLVKYVAASRTSAAALFVSPIAALVSKMFRATFLVEEAAL